MIDLLGLNAKVDKSATVLDVQTMLEVERLLRKEFEKRLKSVDEGTFDSHFTRAELVEGLSNLGECRTSLEDARKVQRESAARRCGFYAMLASLVALSDPWVKTALLSIWIMLCYKLLFA